MDDAQDLLEQLDRLNLFVIPLDNRREWFRYHHLFAEWLRLQAREDPHERHRIAADWLAADHQPGDAIRHYVSAGEADRGAALIDRERWVLVGQGREETLREWTQLLPPEVRRRHPQLTLAAAWVAHHAGRWDDLHSLVDSFQSEPPASSVGDGALVQAEVALLESGRLIALGRSEEALQMAGAGLALIPDDEPRARTGLLLVTGRCHMAFGDLGQAERAFRSARELAAPYNVTIVEVIGARTWPRSIASRAVPQPPKQTAVPCWTSPNAPDCVITPSAAWHISRSATCCSTLGDERKRKRRYPAGARSPRECHT